MKRTAVCKSVGYINRIAKNLAEIKEENLERLLQVLKQSRRIILVAEGRSRSALLIGIKGTRKRIFAPTDSSFHWRNMTEAAIELRKKRGKTTLLVNSGSGKTTTPKEMVNELRAYINKTGTKKFAICTVTSHPESKIAKQSDVIVELKGREEKEEASQDSGMMGDIFELASMVLFQEIKNALNNDLSAKEILVAVKKEMEIIGKLIDNYLTLDHYRKLVKETADRSITVFGGLGPDREVAEMTAIRTMHIKSVARGSSVSLAGSLALPPMPGHLIILISFSGETKSTVKWCFNYKEAGGIVFSIVGNKSALSEEGNSYILKAPLGKFYVRAAFVLSPLPGGVMKKFREHGIHIPESMIRTLGHSKTE